jgi:hypothetical protein
VNRQIGDRHRLFHVDLARPAVVPQPVRHVRVLLDLAEHDAGANRMHRMGGREVRLARRDRNPVEQLLNVARLRGLQQSLARDGLAEPERDRRTRLRFQDVPHLGLAEPPVLAVVGMHLHRKPLRREQQFDEQRQFAIRQIPRLADGLIRIGEPRRETRLSPHLLAQGRLQPYGFRHLTSSER